MSEFALPLRATFHPYGYTVEVATNSPAVLEAGAEAWCRFRPVFAELPVHLSFGVLDGGLLPTPLQAPVVRARRHLISWVAGPEDFVFCDMKQGFAFGWLRSTTVANRPHLRYHYLESAAYTLLEALYVTPVHAACVALHGRGVLLCGESEAGKSSLAYACARRGWTYISDDSSLLIRERATNVVVGNPYLIRLRESAPALFPELRDQPVILRAQGERAIELSTAGFPNLATALHAQVDYIVFLDRQPCAEPALSPFPREQAWRQFKQVLAFGEPELKDAQVAALRRLLSVEMLTLRYSSLDDAVAHLRLLVEAAAPPRSATNLPVEYRENA